MPVRSAIYYPEIEISSEETMRNALLLWDEVKVIVPYPEYEPRYDASDTMRAAWELIGDTFHPDQHQKEQADRNIRASLQNDPIIELYREDVVASAESAPFEIWPQKLLPETWEFLLERSVTSRPLANGDYPFEEQSGFAIMAKLADACAGTTFARWTDRFLAYGLVADRTSQADLESKVIPLTLSMAGVDQLTTQALISLRKREIKERGGIDYRKLRHAYVDHLNTFVDSIKDIESHNELTERYRQFTDETTAHVRNLTEASGFNLKDTLSASAIVSVVVATSTWLAGHHSLATLTAGVAASAAPKVAEGVASLFHSHNSYSSKQREILAKNPLAYLYQLSRV